MPQNGTKKVNKNFQKVKNCEVSFSSSIHHLGLLILPYRLYTILAVYTVCQLTSQGDKLALQANKRNISPFQNISTYQEALAQKVLIFCFVFSE